MISEMFHVKHPLPSRRCAAGPSLSLGERVGVRGASPPNPFDAFPSLP